MEEVWINQFKISIENGINKQCKTKSWITFWIAQFKLQSLHSSFIVLPKTAALHTNVTSHALQFFGAKSDECFVVLHLFLIICFTLLLTFSLMNLHLIVYTTTKLYICKQHDHFQGKKAFHSYFIVPKWSQSPSNTQKQIKRRL